ncbi:hypothetical protein CJ469_06204 [Nocardia farcinica]|uniref:hypothetical protein n=1 Tax=Nocardia farcinica TaxID=37329 RepID=UPI000C013F83|nr:hypothetical protein [Nocardia farcinica]PFW98446.1 hypothetical protein CJ469_06204 [Nocardia farcinica]PFX02089.1 hypothetical protein CJ468_05989 [Nocardia farcinica]SUE28413.1 Uncharacterised protein [Nocardia farcinica]
MTNRVRITAEATALNPVERIGRPGRTIRSYIEEFGGSWEGTLTDPFDISHRVSLEPFKSHNPELYLKIQFRVSRDDEDFDFDYSDAVVLKEYDLPAGVELPQ